MGFQSCLLRLLPFAAMVMLEFVDTALNVISKAAMSKGMSHFVFVVYSNALATLIMFLSSFFFYRTKRPPLTYSLLCKFFLLSLVGITVMQNCVFTGVNYSSPTLASATVQVVPAFTFLLAVILRMEKLDLRSSISRIKIMGTVVSITGAMIIIFYKGPPIGATTFPSNPDPVLTAKKSWVIGGFFLATASFSLSIFTTFQAAILEGYPSEMTIVSFYCLFGTIQCAIVSLIAEKNPNAWKLKPDIELVSVIYSAVFGNVVTYSVMTWCIHKKGPVFVAMFKPLGIAIAAFLSVIFLGDTLHVGSIIGAIIIVAGFYGALWAKSQEKEQSEIKQINEPQSTPLLGSHTDV